MMADPPVPSSAPLDTEKLHILLTYSALLALTRDPSRPVVDLHMEGQVRQLDAFLAGDITEDGVATHWSAESKTPERLQRYKDLCDQLVPNMTAAIKKQSLINLNTTLKNLAIGDKNPEHQSFSELFLSPSLVAIYGKLVEKSRKKGIDPDFDPWTNTVKHGKLIKIFQAIYEFQYDLTGWQHIRPKPVFNQKPHSEAEEFMRVMDDKDQIRVYHHVSTPLGRQFSQLDTIPETTITYTEKQLFRMLRDKTRPKYLIPDPAAVTIPPKRKDIPWVNADGVGKIWTRGETSWSPSWKFMVFDKATNAYLRHHLVDPELLDQIDLNDDTWVTRYRKKISQWRGRATGETIRVSEHWTNEERVVVYEFINKWVKKNGIDKFAPLVWEDEKVALKAALANKAGHERSAESFRHWGRRQMLDKPHEPLGVLYIKAQDIATRINAGDAVPDNERYPDKAIDIADFIAKTVPKKTSGYKDYGSKYDTKRKHENGIEFATGDVMNDPRNFNIDDDDYEDSNVSMEADQNDSYDVESPVPSPSKSNKRPKLTAKNENHPEITTSEQDVTLAKPKRLTKVEMNARVAEQKAEAAAAGDDTDDDEINMDLELDTAVDEEDEEAEEEDED
jgi:hypothetical protein